MSRCGAAAAIQRTMILRDGTTGREREREATASTHPSDSSDDDGECYCMEDGW